MSTYEVTFDDRRFREDLAQLAAEQYRVADGFCGTCRNYHALWPYRRLARVTGAADAGGTTLEFILAEAFAGDRRRVLIAGAADTGLLALTARAGAAFDIGIVVLDRCPTPLELCRRFAQRWSINAEVLHQDLTSLDVVAAFDVIFANSLLPFIAPERRVEALSRLRRALRPDGRLINVFNVGARLEGEALSEYRARYSGWVIAELDRQRIPIPEARETFLRRLDDYARELESREGEFGRPEQLLALHERSGFDIISCAEIDMALALPWQQFVAKLAKRRYIVVARPHDDAG
jgi:SAM-dependent methyltransferase